MPRRRNTNTLQKHEFANKLLLNQWLISLFGIDPLGDGYTKKERPFHKLVEHLRVTREGLDADGYQYREIVVLPQLGAELPNVEITPQVDAQTLDRASRKRLAALRNHSGQETRRDAA